MTHPRLRYLAEHAANFTGFFPGSARFLYPALHRLEDRGGSKAEWKISEQAAKQVLSLTKKGRKQFGCEIAHWERFFRERRSHVFAPGIRICHELLPQTRTPTPELDSEFSFMLAHRCAIPLGLCEERRRISIFGGALPAQTEADVPICCEGESEHRNRLVVASRLRKKFMTNSYSWRENESDCSRKTSQ